MKSLLPIRIRLWLANRITLSMSRAADDQRRLKALLESTEDGFEHLVGYRNSLIRQIDEIEQCQAKRAALVSELTQ